MSKASQATEISLYYSLFDLPTAQHKAGLAGLLLLIESMRQRGLGPLPIVSDLTATSVKLMFTQPGLQAVFDDLYDAEIEEVEPKEKTPKHEKLLSKGAKRKTEKVKKSKRFVVPKALFLEHHYPGGENGWLKLWRNAVFDTLRTRDKNRLVYKERAAGAPSGEAKDAWKQLVKFSQKLGTGELLNADISSSLFIGAQALNAERVPFNGRVDQNLLLHFWPLTIQVFVPEVIDREGSRELKKNAYTGLTLSTSSKQRFGGDAARLASRH